MRKILLVCLLTWSCLPTLARTPDQVNLITNVTDASVSAEKSIKETYETQALKIIEEAPSLESALIGLAALDRKWDPAFSAWEDLRYEHDNCLMSTERCDEEALKDTWCSLENKAEALGARIPDVLEC
jgi:hypothetical protein